MAQSRSGASALKRGVAKRPSWIGPLTDAFEPLALLVRHIILFLVVAAAIMALAIAAYVASPASYMATGTVLVGDPEPSVTESPGDTMRVGDPADMESQLTIVRSQAVMRRALASKLAQDALRTECEATGGDGLDGDCENLGQRINQVVEYVSSRYSVTSAGRSRIINISYTSPQPQVAADMANALIFAFLDAQKDTLTESRETAATWLRQEAADLDAEIRRLDKQIADYRAANDLVRGANGPVNAERLSGLNQQLALAQAAQANAEARLKEITGAGQGGSANATAVLENRTVGDLKQSLSDVESRLATSQTSLGPSHPRLRALEDERRVLNERLASEINRITLNARKQYDAASERVSAITAQLQAAKVAVSSDTLGETNIDDIVRQAEIKRSQYLDVSSKVNNLEIERQIRMGTVRLVSEAQAPLRPFFPKLVPFAAAGMTLALLSGFVAAFLADKLTQGGGAGRRSESDSAVQSDAETAMPNRRYDSAAAPPYTARRSVDLLALIPLVEPLDPYDRTMQSALDAAAADPDMHKAMGRLELATTDARVVLVTSASTGSGATFTVAALSRHLATIGRPVLVIDCNIERPMISSVLGVPFSAVWNGAETQAMVFNSTVPGIDIIPAGHAIQLLPPDQWWEQRLAETLGWATSTYPLVLIDGPAAGAFHAQALAAYADLVVVCATRQQLESDVAAGAAASIMASARSNLGFVATMTDIGNRASSPQPLRAAAGWR